MPAPQAVFRSKFIFIFLFFVVAVSFYVDAPGPQYITKSLQQIPLNVTSSSWSGSSQKQQQWKPTQLKDLNTKYAYATFLAGNDMDEVEDVYLLGARLLAYQLLHDPQTRSNGIPFIVAVTKTVAPAKIERLQREGAVTVVVDDLVAEWIYKINPDNPLNPRFKDVMTKLRLWEFTQFERICLLDGDTVLVENIDGVFDDPATKMMVNKNSTEFIRHDEGPQPEEYAIASRGEPRTFFFLFHFPHPCIHATFNLQQTPPNEKKENQTQHLNRIRPRIPPLGRKRRIRIRPKLLQQRLHRLPALARHFFLLHLSPQHLRRPLGQRSARAKPTQLGASPARREHALGHTESHLEHPFPHYP